MYVCISLSDRVIRDHEMKLETRKDYKIALTHLNNNIKDISKPIKCQERLSRLLKRHSKTMKEKIVQPKNESKSKQFDSWVINESETNFLFWKDRTTKNF